MRCRKCLLQEFDAERYNEEIKKEIDWMDEEMRASDELREKRLDSCRECEKLLEGCCLVCGCYVELRAAAKAGHCPRKRW